MKTIEEIREAKNKRINELLQEKNVDIQDDYFTDIFNEAGTHNEIFRVMSSRGFEKHPELITEHCRSRVESSKLSQHDVIKNEVAVCDCDKPLTERYDRCCKDNCCKENKH